MSELHGFIDTLRLNEAQLREVLDSLDQEEPDEEDNWGRKRRDSRDLLLPFREPDLKLTIDHPGGGQSPFLIAGRNLTPHGLGFLHGNYLHKGTPGRLELPLTVGGFTSIRCTVIWCRHVRNHIHEAAVLFEQPIDLWRHMEGADAAADIGTRIDPAELNGSVLIFSESELFRDLIAHQLEETKLQMHIGGDLEEIGRKAQTDPPELVILNAEFEGSDVEAQVRTLREAPIFCPILLATGEPSAQRIQPSRDAGASGVLRMPFQPMQLLAMLLEWITLSRANTDADESETNLTQQSPEFRALLIRYLKDLETHAQDLTSAIEADEFEKARAITRRIYETGGIFGKSSLSRWAKNALTQLDSCYSIQESSFELQRLLQQAHRACASGKQPAQQTAA